MSIQVPFTLRDSRFLQANDIIGHSDMPTTNWSTDNADRCIQWLEGNYAGKAFLTSSCTSAMEVVALTVSFKKGDEVIVPSFTHVSSVLPFVNLGLKPVFADISGDNLCLDLSSLEARITSRTKVIVSVNYGGWSPDYQKVRALCKRNGVLLVEDNAHGIGAVSYEGVLGTFGDFSVFSFEKQKNISCQEGGALIVHNRSYVDAVNEILSIGTDKALFEKGDKDFYEWVGKGIKSSLTEFQAAHLFPQLEQVEEITRTRITAWNYYHKRLMPLGKDHFEIPRNNEGHNGHIYYLILKSRNDRDDLIKMLYDNGVQAQFHYYPLHMSKYGSSFHDGSHLPVSEVAGLNLLRLPLFNEISREQQDWVISLIMDYFHCKETSL